MYGPEYVNILFDCVRRNLPAGFAGDFTCFTDDPTGLEAGIKIKPLPEGVEGWWNKLYLFSPEAFPAGERVLYFDLDTAITGPLDEIARYDGPFAILRDFYRPNGLGSGVMAWESSNCTRLFWERWQQQGRPQPAGGDQEWVEQCIAQGWSWPVDLWQERLPGKFRSYKVDCRTQIPRGTSVVCFHGYPKPHEVVSGWVPEVWKVGGGSAIEWVVQSNVPDEKLRANVLSAMARDCKWVEPGNDARTAIIVGGGPSIATNLFYIRGMQMSGAKVYATNKTFSYLVDNGITPDAHVMLDARQENIEFVHVGDVPRYYASQCHPSVLAAAGDELICWHAAMSSYQPLLDKAGVPSIGGGTTVGMKAIVLAYLLGHRHINLFGFDSSYDDGAHHHAYPQSLNDGEKTLDVRVGGRSFRCAPWMVTQAEDFKEHVPLLLENGCTIRVFGDGLIPHIASLLKPPTVDERAQQILAWLKDIPHPEGAEIGVFTGALSQRLLLNRPDLKLLMVDPWAAGNGEDGLGEFHGSLSQDEQDHYYEATQAAVQFAGKRALILRETSLSASVDVPDGALDFVFIDADHSYECCLEDIKAWLPKIKPGGFISGHDYENPNYPTWGVKRAVEEVFGTVDVGADFCWRKSL
jgi:uncharacterized Rossmann fold enzyme